MFRRTRLAIQKTSVISWLELAVLSAASLHLIAVMFVVLSRINYRYELEWMEGASLVQVLRIYTGQSLYTQPTLSYIPMLYAPLYFYVAAALAGITGISFLPLRLVSFGSTLACVVAIYLIVQAATKSRMLSMIAAGSFLATFKLGGAWFDIGRVDMLSLAFTLVAVFVLSRQTTTASMLAGLSLSLAFLAKQTALPVFVVLAGSTLLLFRKQTIPFVGSFLALASAAYLGFHASTAGWSTYYVFRLAAGERIVWSAALDKFSSGFAPVALFVLIGLAPLLFDFRKVMKNPLHAYYYLAIVGIGAAAAVARINAGAYYNALIPAYAGIAVMFGMGMGWTRMRPGAAVFRTNLFQAAVWLLILGQFVLLRYDLAPQIPTAADRRAGEALVAELQGARGDVLVPFHNYLAVFAGKQAYFHMVAYYDLRGDFSRSQLPEFQGMLRQFRRASPSLLIMDTPDAFIREHDCYHTRQIDYESAATFLPVTGYSVRPTIQYIRDATCP